MCVQNMQSILKLLEFLIDRLARYCYKNVINQKKDGDRRKRERALSTNLTAATLLGFQHHQSCALLNLCRVACLHDLLCRQFARI